jgi:hypothetical protein
VRLGSRILYRQADIEEYLAEHLHGGHAIALVRNAPRQRGRLQKNLNISATDAS